MTDRAQTSDSRKLDPSKKPQAKHNYLAKNNYIKVLFSSRVETFLLGYVLGAFVGRSRSSSHEAMKGLQIRLTEF